MNAIHKINPEKVFSKILKKNNQFLTFYKIAEKWEELVKKKFIKTTYPLKLLKNKTLFIAVPNSSVGSQFYYSKNDVISKINLYLGENTILDIKTTLKPSDKWSVLQNDSSIKITL